MINEIKSQACQNIENVVTGYRNDETRTNYRWKVKKEYQPNGNWIVLALMIGMLFFVGVYSGFLNFPRYVSWFGFAPLICVYMFYIVVECNKRFQEKFWFIDVVSDEDILQLCENPDLKPLIKYAIEHDDLLTYTSLLEMLPNYLSRIEIRHRKMLREELIKKIDQN